jgi:protein associated with RNAse G/E
MNTKHEQIIVIKMNTQGEETWRYTGRILSREKNTRLIEAYFNRTDLLFHGITLRENDRFLERYYDNRWYNIFEIHDRDDDRIKAWYCNVTRPAEFNLAQIAYVDLALDVLVYPDGKYLVLDEDEFKKLDLDQSTEISARHALNTLVALAKNNQIDKEI